LSSVSTSSGGSFTAAITGCASIVAGAKIGTTTHSR
jgi:hypothetical protein